MRLLVIEDDDLGRKALTSILEAWGCAVTATDGVQAACQQMQLAQDAGLVLLQKPVRPAKLRKLLRHLHQEKAC